MNAPNGSSSYLPNELCEEIDRSLSENVEIFRPDRDKLLTIIKTILEWKDEGEGWVYIPATHLKKEIGESYDLHLKWLNKYQIIEIDKYYEVGKHSRAYRLHSRFNGQEPRLVDIKNHSSNGQASGTDFRFLDDFDKNLKIDEDLASEATGRKFASDTASYDNKCIDYEARISHASWWEHKSIKNIYRPANPTKSRHRSYNAIHKIKHGISYPKQDDFSGRAYFNPTVMPSYLRQYLTYDGKDQIIADLISSQPYILSMIWNNPHYFLYLLIHLPMRYYNRKGVIVPRIKGLARISCDEVAHILQCVEPFKHSFDNKLTANIEKAFRRLSNRPNGRAKYHPTLRSQHMVRAALRLHDSEIFQEILRGKLPEDIIRFQEALEKGELYEQLADEFGCDRKTSKTIIMNNFFSANKGRVYGKSLLKSNFPSVYELLMILKREHKRLLSFLLQFFETSVMLYHIANTVHKKYPYINLHPIHDAIMTSKEYMPLVKKVIEESFRKLVGKTPLIRCES